MLKLPDQEELRAALAAAGSAHHEFEQNYLAGVRDEAWAGWYAAYVLGRLGDFAPPTALARWLEEAAGDGPWSDVAARHVADRIGTTGA